MYFFQRVISSLYRSTWLLVCIVRCITSCKTKASCRTQRITNPLDQFFECLVIQQTRDEEVEEAVVTSRYLFSLVGAGEVLAKDLVAKGETEGEVVGTLAHHEAVPQEAAVPRR